MIENGLPVVTLNNGAVVPYQGGPFPFSDEVTVNGRPAVAADIVLDQKDILGMADFRAANSKLLELIEEGTVQVPNDCVKHSKQGLLATRTRPRPIGPGIITKRPAECS